MRTSLALLLCLGGCDSVFSLRHVDDIDVDAYTEVVLADHPVGYFRLGETRGVTARNLVAGGPSGTFVGNFTLGAEGAIAGDADGALELDGGNGAVDLGDVFDFPGLQPFTLEAWIKPGFDRGFHSILAKWHARRVGLIDNEGYDFFYQDSELVLQRELGDAGDRVAVTGLVEGAYNHVVATFDGANVRLFIDGVMKQQTGASLVMLDNAMPFLIGAGDHQDLVTLLGSIDEAAIYSVALPADRVFAHYNAGSL